MYYQSVSVVSIDAQPKIIHQRAAFIHFHTVLIMTGVLKIYIFIFITNLLQQFKCRPSVRACIRSLQPRETHIRGGHPFKGLVGWAVWRISKMQVQKRKGRE